MDILFLDDDPERTRSFQSIVPYADCVKTAEECIETLQSNDRWDIVFLDHDLGGEVYVDSNKPDCGMEVVRWICNTKPDIDRVIVHTMNPPAALRMEMALKFSGYIVDRIPFCNIGAWIIGNL